MLPNSRIRLALWSCLGAGLLLAACQTAAPTVAKPTAVILAGATPAASATNTIIPDTPTATLSDTATASATTAATPTATASPTAAPTSTPPPTTTVESTALPKAKRVPATPAPTAQPAPVYSTTDGPAGYSSGIKCERSGASCVPVMPPGDVSFRIVLSSDATAPWTHFVDYGLSVEKDGANMAKLFMFVDAGWLQPGSVVGFGASRNFSQPGTYVIRSSGCMTIDQNSNNCAWTIMPGDVVTFVIQ
jgi:hypothetical protein